MNDIDDRITQALSAEDRELFDRLASDRGIIDETFQVFRGRHRWLTFMTVFAMTVMFGAAIASAVAFFGAEEVRWMIAYASAFIFCMLAVGMLKFWFWLEMQRNAITRDIKRVELRIAQLARKPGSDA